MRELELDGIHDDGEHIVLRDLDGEQYTLRIDEAVRAAVRRDRPALGLIQSSEATALRPREIQAMLRAGHTAENISQMASIDLEHVRRYEGPVLAERGFTAERARTFKVDRSGGPVLDSIVTERLAARQALEGTRWDAWRLPDGTWNLELVFRSGGREREAHWIADMIRQIVVAEDDEARWLSLDDDALDQPVVGRARLTSLKSSVYDQESDADGASARPRRSTPRSLQRPGSVPPQEQTAEDERPVGTGSAADGDPIDEDALEQINARRGLRPVPLAGDEEPTWSTLEEDEQRSTRAADEEAEREYAVSGSHPDQDTLPEAYDEDDVDGGTDRPEDDQLDVTGGPEGDTDPGEDPEADGRTPLVVPGRTLDESVAEGTEDPREDTHTPGTGEATRGAAGERPAAAVPSNDTVDLTPLPGFDDVPTRASANSGEQDTAAKSEDPAPDSGPRRGTKKDTKKGEKKNGSSSPSRAKRSSIPSWDEIVFGSKHD
ncbi:DUF3071 domain-containing protein [Brachybacterium endophyticum]|uniref:DUF3071 domain-containing protein n=1 Tax=Brachybacterium endophyticum TaxID=2182385 RepID=A0A2U2RJ68_9MICO|nr:septation protein SepH [Brachybacterium endophyticum]PWH05835.1 DUF3071 domain-containing protein [Brachybacterium endophyticum]